jgi:hypothetical protein
VAVFGAIFSARLGDELAARIPGGSLGDTEVNGLLNSPEQISRLPAALRDGVVDAVTASVHSVFWWAVPLLVVGFVLALLLPERPLRTSVGNTEPVH